jgi:hypothetical protein
MCFDVVFLLKFKYKLGIGCEQNPISKCLNHRYAPNNYQFITVYVVNIVI